ncbi:MAG: histidinol-phosphate transaminase [Candidatus Bipolaricaulota bacterium]
MTIRDRVKNLAPYSSEREKTEIRLDKNESPFSLPKQLKRRIMTQLKDLSFNRYPSSSSEGLREKLADFHSLKKENVVAGSGSDQLISYAVKLFSGDRVVITPPTFSMYRFYSNFAGFDVLEVPLTENFNLRHEQIKEAIRDSATLFLCSPNNPTGNTFERKTIVDLLETGTPLILDEAYAEFSGKSEIDLIKEYDNLIVLRTFSKAFGVAGARIGYAVASETTADYLLKVKPPYNLNSLSESIAEVLLDNHEIIQDRVEFIREERNRIYERFEKYSYPTEANFILMDLDAHEFLLEKGIGVRKFSGRLADKIRVTVGTKEENDRLLESLEEFIESRTSSRLSGQ